MMPDIRFRVGRMSILRLVQQQFPLKRKHFLNPGITFDSLDAIAHAVGTTPATITAAPVLLSGPASYTSPAVRAAPTPRAAPARPRASAHETFARVGGQRSHPHAVGGQPVPQGEQEPGDEPRGTRCGRATP